MGLWDFFTGSGSVYKALNRAKNVYDAYSSVVNGDVAGMFTSLLSLATDGLEHHSESKLKAALQKKNAIQHYKATSFEEQEALEKMLEATNEAIRDISNKLGYYETANNLFDLIDLINALSSE